jgi:hypothetical protein
MKNRRPFLFLREQSAGQRSYWNGVLNASSEIGFSRIRERKSSVFGGAEMNSRNLFGVIQISKR